MLRVKHCVFKPQGCRGRHLLCLGAHADIKPDAWAHNVCWLEPGSSHEDVPICPWQTPSACSGLDCALHARRASSCPTWSAASAWWSWPSAAPRRDCCSSSPTSARVDTSNLDVRLRCGKAIGNTLMPHHDLVSRRCAARLLSHVFKGSRGYATGSAGCSLTTAPGCCATRPATSWCVCCS